MSVTIEPVRSGAQLDAFITLPRRLYEGMAGYVAPLDMERRELLDPNKSPFFRHGRAAYWVARRDGTPVGRISAQIDELAGPATPPNLGLFGCLDAIDDCDVVARLLQTAERWLMERKCRLVRGPFQLSINGETGLLTEGQTERPMILLPWHPAYLDRHVQAAGYGVAMRLLSFVLDLNELTPEDLQRLAPKQRDDLTIASMRLNDFDKEMETARQIYNDGWQRNWGFVPAAMSDTRGLAHSFKQFLLPDSGFFLNVNGAPAGFVLTVPNIFDLSADLGAAPGPFSWVRLLFRMVWRRYRSFRLVLIGAATKYHRTGLGKVALFETIRRLRARGAKELSCAWVLQSNSALIRILIDFKFQKSAIYNVYEKHLLN